MLFIHDLNLAFQENANRENAMHMEAYMKNKFKFFGIKANLRRDLMWQCINNHKTEINSDYKSLALDLYNLQQREFHMCAIDIFHKFGKNKWQKQDIEIIEHLLVTHSWWDSVDFIAKQILGNYLLHFKEEISSVAQKFSVSSNIWLIRSSIIFQLSYKDKTDKDLLYKHCLKHKDSKEFFVQKAIGWALREYGKINPTSVLNFVNTYQLRTLSQREAIRNILKNETK